MKKPGIAALVVGVEPKPKKGAPSPPDSDTELSDDSEEAGEPGFDDAAEELLEAAKGDDAKLFASKLRACIQLCKDYDDGK